jgi:hypothetical protein
MPKRRSYIDHRLYGILDDDPSLRISASGESKCVVRFADDLTTLTVRGFIWDTVIGSFTVTDLCVDVNHQAFIPESFKSVCAEILSILEKFRGIQYNGDPKSALWRTLVSVPGGELCKAEAKWYEEECPIEAELETRATEVTDTLFNWSTPKLLASFESFYSKDRNIVITDCGFVGQAPSLKLVNEEDLVCVLLGCLVLMVLQLV